jgi:hypothetical protein
MPMYSPHTHPEHHTASAAHMTRSRPQIWAENTTQHQESDLGTIHCHPGLLQLRVRPVVASVSSPAGEAQGFFTTTSTEGHHPRHGPTVVKNLAPAAHSMHRHPASHIQGPQQSSSWRHPPQQRWPQHHVCTAALSTYMSRNSSHRPSTASTAVCIRSQPYHQPTTRGADTALPHLQHTAPGTQWVRPTSPSSQHLHMRHQHITST